MASWHQSQARKRNPVRLDHPTMWVVLIDPPGEPASSILHTTQADADACAAAIQARGQRGVMVLPPRP